jgi:hypothetical protein
MQMGQYPKYSKGIEGILIDNQDGNKTIVLVNPNENGCQAQIKINEKFWYVELYADSICTITLEV